MSAVAKPDAPAREPAFLFPDLRPRSPVVVEHMPALARALARMSPGKLRGARRIKSKVLQSALRWSRRLKLPARGQLALLHPEGPRRFSGDFNNTALIYYARHIAQGGVYEPAVTALIDMVAPRLRGVYDVGANWGYFVALLATNAEFDGRVHAFEVAPDTFRQLAAMVEECGLGDHVLCHPIGLSDRTGRAVIIEGLHSALTRVAEQGTGREARVARLDDLAGVDPDLVKIDVEGHEAAVLRGAALRLARAKPLIVLESWYIDGAHERMLEPLRFLRDLGYELYQPVWRNEAAGVASFGRSPGQPGPTALALLPLPVEERPLIPIALDLVALHPQRRSLLTGF